MSRAKALLEKMGKDSIKVGNKYIFTKSGSEVEVIKLIDGDRVIAKRVDTGKSMVIPISALKIKEA